MFTWNACALYIRFALSTDNDSFVYSAASNQSIFNIVVLPALYLFTIQTYVILPAESDAKHKFPARIFVANTALWVLIWFGHNLKVKQSPFHFSSRIGHVFHSVKLYRNLSEYCPSHDRLMVLCKVTFIYDCSFELFNRSRCVIFDHKREPLRLILVYMSFSK